ncbi:MAG: hypothetical protein NDI69_02635 [Bacteriovoracaceae bacterium]|nr:hypothetical protein [Bacteriovoracaceae bacterium]
MKTLFKSEKGVGMVEVLMGFALAGVGAFIILNAVDYLGEKKSIVDKNASMENLITGLMESIRSNIVMEKIDFEADEFLNHTTFEAVEESLKLCWVNDGILLKADYPDCPGKIGYVITPMKAGNMEFRGLFKVTIRLTHQELFPGQFKQYEFIVKDP